MESEDKREMVSMRKISKRYIAEKEAEGDRKKRADEERGRRG